MILTHGAQGSEIEVDEPAPVRVAGGIALISGLVAIITIVIVEQKRKMRRRRRDQAEEGLEMSEIDILSWPANDNIAIMWRMGIGAWLSGQEHGKIMNDKEIAKYFQLAQERRDATPVTPVSLACHKFHSKIWCWPYIIVVLAHCSLIFFEASSQTRHVLPTLSLLLIEWVFTCLHAINLILVVLSWDANEFSLLRLRTFGHIASFVVVCLIIVDMICLTLDFVNGTLTLGHFSRAIRPLLLLPLIRQVRNAIKALIESTVVLKDIFMFLAVIIVIFAGVMRGLFRGWTKSFDNFSDGIIALIVLATTENYPNISYEVLEKSQAFWPIFMLYILFVCYFILNVALGVVYHTFKQRRELETVRDRRETYKALSFVFMQLCRAHSVTRISFLMARNFIDKIRPGWDGPLKPWYCKVTGSTPHATIDVIHFMKLCELPLVFEMTSNQTMPNQSMPKWHVWLRCGVYVLQSLWFMRPVDLPSIVYDVVNGIFVVSVCIDAINWMKKSPKVIEKTALAKIDSNASIEITELGADVRRSTHARRVIDAVISSASLTVYTLYWFMAMFYHIDTIQMRVMSAMLVLPLLRILVLYKPFRNTIKLVVETLKSIWPLVTIILVIFYSSAVIGMELFDQKLLTNIDYAKMHKFEHFDSFPAALFTLFQIMTLSNWHDIMLPAVAATSNRSAVYFVAFATVVGLCLMTVLSGLVIEIYIVVFERPPQQYSLIWRSVLRQYRTVIVRRDPSDPERAKQAIDPQTIVLPPAPDLQVQPVHNMPKVQDHDVDVGRAARILAEARVRGRRGSEYAREYCWKKADMRAWMNRPKRPKVQRGQGVVMEEILIG